MMSGPPIDPHFSEGWALKIQGGRVAHYWRRHRTGDSGSMLCRPARLVPLRLSNGQEGLLYPGDFPRCKRCVKCRAGAAK